MSFLVYILASKRNGTLYVGMTDDLSRRTWEHKTGVFPGFTKKYGVKALVWFEAHESAFVRERQIKKWERKWKLHLIEEMNPEWKDLGRASHKPVSDRGQTSQIPLIPAHAGIQFFQGIR